MNQLKRLFGGKGGRSGDPDGMYFYVRANPTGEVIQVRLHRYNDLTLSDDEQSYFVRKSIVGHKSFDRLEADFTFDKNRRLISCEVDGGELVDRAAYDAYLAQEAASAGSDT
ncbi:MAG TPA: hypothetical protein VMT24_03765 [Aggregatilineaceae bacterium]|nr:hypothetical protein [Aggregatilineaceae bacterium]